MFVGCSSGVIVVFNAQSKLVATIKEYSSPLLPSSDSFHLLEGGLRLEMLRFLNLLFQPSQLGAVVCLAR